MGKSYPLFHMCAMGFVLTCAVLASRPAYADSLTGPSSLSLIEGNSSSPQIFTFTNTSGGAETIGAIGLSSGRTSPDLSDFANATLAFAGTTPCQLGGSIANGQSCTLELTFTTPNPAFDTDQDSGTTSFTLKVLKNLNVAFASTSITVTVTDPPLTAQVPEPSTVVLLGTGLLGMVAMGRRRSKSQN